MKEQVEPHNLCFDHVLIRSELKYLIRGNIVRLNCRVFGGKTSPFAVGRVFCVVRHVATVRFWVESEPEPTRQFGTIANKKWLKSNISRTAGSWPEMDCDKGCISSGDGLWPDIDRDWIWLDDWRWMTGDGSQTEDG